MADQEEVWRSGSGAPSQEIRVLPLRTLSLASTTLVVMSLAAAGMAAAFMVLGVGLYGEVFADENNEDGILITLAIFACMVLFGVVRLMVYPFVWGWWHARAGRNVRALGRAEMR